MRALLKFEGCKLWYTKKNFIALLCLLACLLVMVTYHSIRDNNYWPQLEEQLASEQNLLEVEESIAYEELELARERAEAANTPEAEAAVEACSDYADFAQAQRLYVAQQKYLAANYSEDSAQERLELWTARDQHLLDGLESGLAEPSSIFFYNATPLEVQQRLAVNQALLKRGIQPLNSPYEMTATNFLYRLSSFPWLLIVVVVVILLSADMFSGDVQGGAYKVLYSQPLQRSKVYAVKYLLNLGGGILLASLLIALVFGGLSLINETGSTSYPVFYMEESYRSLTIGAATDEILPLISWSTYMLRVLPLYLMLCCFTIVLTGTISLFMNSTANALSVSVCLLFLDYSFRTLLPGDKVFYFIWPLTPLSPNDVLMGYYSPSALSYLILLGALTVLLAAVGLLVLNKRDLKGGAA